MTTDHPQPAAGLARRRRVIAAAGITGTGLLGLALSRRPGSRQFYLLTLGVAATWTVGAVRSRPDPPVRARRPSDVTGRAIIVPVLTGAGAFGLTYGAALATRRIPVLDRAVRDVLRFADGGVTPLLVLTTGANAIAEELFFRGALFSAMCESRPVIASTIAYAAATSATRNPALVLAGATLGALLGLQRRASGGVAAPAVTHLTWSLLTLWFLPRLTCKPAPRRAAEADEATAAAERENCRTAREAPPGQ